MNTGIGRTTKASHVVQCLTGVCTRFQHVRRSLVSRVRMFCCVRRVHVTSHELATWKEEARSNFAFDTERVLQKRAVRYDNKRTANATEYSLARHCARESFNDSRTSLIRAKYETQLHRRTFAASRDKFPRTNRIALLRDRSRLETRAEIGRYACSSDFVPRAKR